MDDTGLEKVPAILIRPFVCLSSFRRVEATIETAIFVVVLAPKNILNALRDLTESCKFTGKMCRKLRISLGNMFSTYRFTAEKGLREYLRRFLSYGALYISCQNRTRFVDLSL